MRVVSVTSSSLTRVSPNPFAFRISTAINDRASYRVRHSYPVPTATRRYWRGWAREWAIDSPDETQQPTGSPTQRFIADHRVRSGVDRVAHR